jgi:hypothetical protein
MKVICAWCNILIRTEEGPDDTRYSVCKKCLSKFKIYPEKNQKALVPAGSPVIDRFLVSRER